VKLANESPYFGIGAFVLVVAKRQFLPYTCNQTGLNARAAINEGAAELWDRRRCRPA
jgi:hypothetical protein